MSFDNILRFGNEIAALEKICCEAQAGESANGLRQDLKLAREHLMIESSELPCLAELTSG